MLQMSGYMNTFDEMYVTAATDNDMGRIQPFFKNNSDYPWGMTM